LSATPENNVERLVRALMPFAENDLVLLFQSEGGARQIREALDEIASPDLVTLMIGAERGLTGTFHGRDGFIEAWRDFVSTFRTLRQEILDMTEVKPDVVLTETRQVGTTATAGVEIENNPAAIFRFGDGQLQQAEFHLDREAARKAAGLAAEDRS
jgi:ketosteroid isomerase-like protein